MASPTVWTPERVRILTRLVKDGALVCTQEQAAKLCGVACYTVKTYCYAHNIKPRWPNSWTPDHQKILMQHVKDGHLIMTVNALAKKMDVSVSVLSSQARHQKIATLNNTGEMKRRVIEGLLKLSGHGVMTVSEEVAAARIGCSRYAVEDMMKLLELDPMPAGTLNYSGRRSKVWTPQHTETLRGWTDARGQLTITAAEAAKRLKLDLSTLKLHMGRLGVLPKRTEYEWTQARLRLLRALGKDGLLTVSVDYAAQHMGCSISQLRMGLAQLNLRPQPKLRWSKERLAKLRRLIDAKGRLTISKREACKRLQCNYDGLNFGLVLLKSPFVHKYEWTPARLNQLRWLSEAGLLRYPIAEVMRVMGCSEKVLQRGMATLGLRAQPRFEWTAEAEAKLAALMRPDGKLSVTYDEAAERIGCSPRSIDYKMTRERKIIKDDQSR